MDRPPAPSVEQHLAPIRSSLSDIGMQLVDVQTLLVDLERRLARLEARPEPDSFSAENKQFINAEGKTE